MTNTYSGNATNEEKSKEELRLIRCLLERLLRVFDESMFVDYQLEKFGKKFKLDTSKGCGNMFCSVCDELCEEHNAYCFKCGRSPHYICGESKLCPGCQKINKGD